MNNFFALFSKNQSLIYKGFLFILSTFLVIYLLPKGGQFKYNFQKGKPWQYENLYAPFSFTIKKDAKTLEQERETIKENATPYFEYDAETVDARKEDFLQLFNDAFVDSLYATPKETAQNEGLSVFTELYAKGVIDEVYPYDKDQLIYLKRGNEIEELAYSQFFRKENIKGRVSKLVSENATEDIKILLQKVLERAVIPNVTLNTKLTEASVESEINAINPNRGVVEKGGRIIAKGEVVEGDTYQILNSLKAEYQSQVWSKSNYSWLIVGYIIIVSLVFSMLFLFLKKYRFDIFNNNTKVTFIFFNVILMVFLTTIVVNLDAKYVYVVPLCILPLILKAFFDPRLGLFVHVLTLMLLGFVVPNSFEYLFLQLIAGIVTILTVSELYRRANLFISVGQITLVYIVGYFAFFILQEGNVQLIIYAAYFLFP